MTSRSQSTLRVVELDLRQAPGLALGRDLAHPLLPQVDDLGRPGCPPAPGGATVSSAPSSAVEHDGALPGLERPAFDEAAHGLGEDDADQVVPGEDERLLEGAGGDHDVTGAEAQEEGARIHGNEAALEDAERRAVDDLEARAGVDAGRVGLDHDDVATLRRVPTRRLAARRAGADHEHLRVAVLDVVALLAAAVLVDLAEAGDAAQELLVERPQAARADHRPVVEADRGEGPADLVGDGQQVVVERAADVLRLDPHALGDRGDARAHVRRSVDREHAVRDRCPDSRAARGGGGT